MGHVYHLEEECRECKCARHMLSWTSGHAWESILTLQDVLQWGTCSSHVSVLQPTCFVWDESELCVWWSITLASFRSSNKAHNFQIYPSCNGVVQQFSDRLRVIMFWLTDQAEVVESGSYQGWCKECTKRSGWPGEGIALHHCCGPAGTLAEEAGSLGVELAPIIKRSS